MRDDKREKTRLMMSVRGHILTVYVFMAYGSSLRSGRIFEYSTWLDAKKYG
jgi:hypothetical protein